MEYTEMLDRLKHIHKVLDGDMRGLTGQLKEEAEHDLLALGLGTSLLTLAFELIPRYIERQSQPEKIANVIAPVDPQFTEDRER